MSHLGIEFITCMKEKKDPSLYEQFVNKVIQHVSAIDTFVRDVAAQEMLQTIKDRTCKYISGDDYESDDDDNDNIMGPVDVIRTFDRAELTKDVRDTISRCFSSMTEAHALMHQAFTEASELIPVLLKRGMALLLEAMATGSIVVQNSKAFNILQEAKVHRQIRDEIKAQENKTCAIDLRIER